MTTIDLDSNATTPILPAALRAAVHAMEDLYGNPSSIHATGLRARAMLDDVRARACRVLGAGAGRVIFTSGATEGIQTAVLSALCAIRARRARGVATGSLRPGSLLVYGATEHKAVPESLAHWNALLGLDLQLVALPVDADGRHDLAALRALAPDAAFVCTMAANNETGVISDLEGIAAALAGSPALWMVDCVQALGKLPLDLAAGRIDYAPFSGHKLHAPKGTGMLYVRDGAPFTPLMTGGGQEAGQRSGTENMAGIAALGAVLAALEEGATFRSHAALQAFRDRIAGALREALPGIVFNAPVDNTLPTTLNFAVPGIAGKELLDLFDAAGVRVSGGSACSAAKAGGSYVLDAMGLPAWQSANAVRLSFGLLTDAATVDEACTRIARCGQALRAAGLPARAETPAVLPLPAAHDDPAIHLAPAALDALLRAHPGVLLVDVREMFEHAAAPVPAGIVNVPLGRLADAASDLLARQLPLVFFCRAGNRSQRAAQYLRRLGHDHAYSLAGGVALNGMPAPTLSIAT